MGITAEEIMTADVTTVDEDTSLGAALEVMQEKRIRHLPVVRGERLVGLLSDRDLKALGAAPGRGHGEPRAPRGQDDGDGSGAS